MAYKGVLGRVQSKLEQMENVAGDLLKQIEGSTKHTASSSAKDIALATEIRAHVKNLKSADGYDQAMMMHELIKAGDKASVSAILDAPAFLSGMTKEEQDEYRKDAQETWAPEAVSQLRMTQSLIKHVWHARDILAARFHVSQARMSHTDAATFSRHLAELREMG